MQYRPVKERRSEPAVPITSVAEQKFESTIAGFPNDWGDKTTNMTWAGIIIRGRRAARDGSDRAIRKSAKELRMFLKKHRATPQLVQN